MKNSILLLAFFSILFSACTTAYKTGQTPDDVYYSPARPQEEYVQTKNENDQYYSSYDDNYYEDRYLRMKIRNRYRWNTLDDMYFFERNVLGYNYYNYNNWSTFNSFSTWNPYYSWNYYYNPYCYSCYSYFYHNPKTITSKPLVKPRNFSLTGYTNSNYNTGNQQNNSISPSRLSRKANTSYKNSNNSSGKGLSNTIRTIISGRNDNSNNSGSSGRTYTPSRSDNNSGNSNSSGSSSSSNSSSSGKSVSRPSRGN